MDSIVMEILRAYHTNRWDFVAMRAFILIDLLPDMITTLNIAATALARHEYRKDELQRLGVAVKRITTVLGEDVLGFLRQPRPTQDRILQEPEGDTIGRLHVNWPGARRRIS